MQVIVVGPSTFVAENKTALEILKEAATAYGQGDMERYRELRRIAARVEMGAATGNEWQSYMRDDKTVGRPVVAVGTTQQVSMAPHCQA